MNRSELKRNLGRVDWWRAAHRLAAFCREMRGDKAEAITADTQREIARSQQLRTSIETFAEKLKGGNP